MRLSDRITNHLPLPWTVEQEGWTGEIRAANGTAIASCEYADEAQLMAQAPLLLAALEKATMAYADQFDNDEPINAADFLNWFTAWREDVKALLKTCELP